MCDFTDSREPTQGRTSIQIVAMAATPRLSDGHPFVFPRIIGDTPCEQRTAGRIARHHRKPARLDFGEQAVLGVQPHFGLPIAFVKTVARETFLGQQRPDTAPKVLLVAGQHRGNGKAQER